MQKFVFFPVAMLLATTAVQGGDMDRPQGIRIGNHLTLRPYVSLSATYDSNVGNYRDAAEDVIWTVSPNLGIDYTTENASLLLNAYYNFRGYTKGDHANEYSQHSYGESLRWNWSNSRGVDRGWTLMVSESYQRINMLDDFDTSSGRSYNGDRDQLQINGAAQRRFNEHWHGDVNAGYYYLNYNDNSYGSSMYGWQRWNVGLEAGFAPSRWTDILLAAGYQGYKQENAYNYNYNQFGNTSQGFTVQGGLGSYMTERISYRALVGWSRFEYGGSGSAANGFVYTLSGNWKIGETWNTMLLATSYYQPSERQYSSQSRVDSVSWGLAKSLVRGKLNATFDVVYRHETQESLYNSQNDYALDILTGRLGFNYVLNRYLTLFTYAEYQRSWNDQDERINTSGYNDFDRWRATLGLRFTY